ncbi:CLUMA_CG003580, isoform A [Clunio marinus]|uniref:CLUMA_CG003580, isoform A n=1 Tax=Clunio marinus TaxID=568069 RepID=A0A1J1HT43_9DIPT|nr:CLUMA_CG003580, isoform A [Clunio marinus]
MKFSVKSLRHSLADIFTHVVTRQNCLKSNGNVYCHQSFKQIYRNELNISMFCNDDNVLKVTKTICKVNMNTSLEVEL